MKGSLIIVGFFAIGVLCGVFNLIPPHWLSGDLSFYALCGLMFSVGLNIGHDPQTVQNFRTLTQTDVASYRHHLGNFIGRPTD